MPEITSKKGYSTIVDDCDLDLSKLKWHATVLHGRVYFNRHITQSEQYKKSRQALHVVILERMLNRTLVKGEMVDHIDDNPLNNRRSNLRLATKAQNMRNTTLRANSTSGFKGVSWNKAAKKYEAHITVDYKKHKLGFYDDPKEAHKAYCEAAKLYFGEFARFE